MILKTLFKAIREPEKKLIETNQSFIGNTLSLLNSSLYLIPYESY
jgi:hypothetical protein